MGGDGHKTSDVVPCRPGTTSPISAARGMHPASNEQRLHVHALHENEVEPPAELEAKFRQASHDREAMPLVESNGARVVSVDGPDHAVLARLEGTLDECVQQDAAHPYTLVVLVVLVDVVDVDGVLHREPVAGPLRGIAEIVVGGEPNDPIVLQRSTKTAFPRWRGSSTQACRVCTFSCTSVHATVVVLTVSLYIALMDDTSGSCASRMFTEGWKREATPHPKEPDLPQPPCPTGRGVGGARCGTALRTPPAGRRARSGSHRPAPAPLA